MFIRIAKFFDLLIVQFLKIKKEKIMLNNQLRVFYSLIFVFLSFLSVTSYASSVIDTFTLEDKEALDYYLAFDFEKSIEDVSIKGYISNKILKSNNRLDEANGLKLIYRLNKKHQPYFGDILFDFIHKNFINDSFSYSYLKPSGEGENLIPAIHALGLIRTEAVIDFILSFIEPAENWPDEFKEIMINNPDRKVLELDFRRNAMGALLQPQDEIGKDLLYLIEEKVNSFNENPETSLLQTYVDIWKKIYETSNVKEFEAYKK